MSQDESRLERLINQCKNNDVDVKVDALTKLQAEFESGVEIKDTDALLAVLKTCLRASNQHLTTATLCALPPLLPLLSHHVQPSTNQPRSPSSSTSSVNPAGIVDVSTLRQVLNTFLPPGGVIDRLGDKEKAQSKARETLVLLGGLAFRASGNSASSSKSRDKGPETPLMMFERFMKEGGLGSKVWKVREQSILAFVHIRRTHHQFPFRPYLSLLVGCLEDTDSHVRECARQSVVELFTGPGVTDGARADLKKEMTKKGVRKAIVDEVLSKLLSSSVNNNPQSREGSENGDATNSKPKEYIPPSLMLQGRRPTVSQNSQNNGRPRTVSVNSVKDISRPESRATAAQPIVPAPAAEGLEIRPIYIASSRDLENEFTAMAKPFEGKETEHNWAAREQAIVRVRSMLKGDVHLRYLETFLLSLKEGFLQWSLKTLLSLRTTVAINTVSLYSELAVALGTSIDPFCDTLLTNLLKMASLTKKIVAQQSQASVTCIIAHTSAQPRIVLPLLWNGLQEKTIQARTFMVAHLKQYLEVHVHRSKSAMEASNGLETIEKFMKKALGDASPAVRETARSLFWDFEEVWPDRGTEVLGTLEPTLRKQVEKACPNPAILVGLAPTTPKPLKKTSVAAAIAASRAKAKAIATAPPSLRHQATSGSHVPPVKRAASPNLISKPPAARAASPLRLSSSPPVPSRGTSGSMTRSVSSTGVVSHHRAPSGGSSSSDRAVSPPLPSEQSTFRRRTSSPLVSTNRSSSIRQALRTVLPPSPPSSVLQVSPTARNPNRNTAPLPKNTRLSLQLDGIDDSLLLAQTVPLPSDGSDTDDNHSINLLSFSSPFERYPPLVAKTQSPAQSFSPRSDRSKPMAAVSNALSSGSIADTVDGQPVVEDALRARAEQAESAAERLLELVEPDEDSAHHSTIPPSLLISSGNGHSATKPKKKPLPIPLPQARMVPPATPVNRAAAIMRQAAMFQDSPAQNDQSPSLIDVLEGNKHETGWWLKRKSLVAQGTPLRAADTLDRAQELKGYIAALADGEPGIPVLQKLVLLCLENPAVESSSAPPSPGFGLPSSPSPFLAAARSLPSLHPDLWDKDKNFEQLLNSLLEFLQPTRSEEEIEYGLILLWEMMESQGRYLEGRESDLFSALLRVRYSNKLNVLEATNTIRDALTTNIEPVYGLTTMHASLRAFHTEPVPASPDEDVKAATYAFGLIALGKFILRLPAEVAEEELPRLKATLISSLNNKSSLIVRESAAAAIIAAQLVLRDETHLFALLDGLADEKKNLLTYLFDKHSVRGLTVATGLAGRDKLQKEIRRLDTRASTPSRPIKNGPR